MPSIRLTRKLKGQVEAPAGPMGVVGTTGGHNKNGDGDRQVGPHLQGGHSGTVRITRL